MKDTLFQMPASEPSVAETKFPKHNPIWTECKAKLIERYLFYFVQITFHGTYIDAFAGPQQPAKPEMWAAKLVLESTPRWLRNFFLFELDESKVKLLEQLRDTQPPRNKQKKESKRKIEIYSGDFNQNIVTFLNENPIGANEATFCLLDQRTFECDWSSVKTIAQHKKGAKKIELFYFFPEGWINRSINAKKIDKDETLEKWWGSANWTELLKTHGVVRANHVCDRFRSEFNYKHVNPFAIYEKKDQGGKIMYYMIHASDHDEAPSLMNRAYGKALEIKETGEQLEFLKEFSHKIQT